MSGYGEKRERLGHRTLVLLALATAIGSAGLAAGAGRSPAWLSLSADSRHSLQQKPRLRPQRFSP
jgi:hypothetical protein